MLRQLCIHRGRLDLLSNHHLAVAQTYALLLNSNSMVCQACRTCLACSAPNDMGRTSVTMVTSLSIGSHISCRKTRRIWMYIPARESYKKCNHANHSIMLTLCARWAGCGRCQSPKGAKQPRWCLRLPLPSHRSAACNCWIYLGCPCSQMGPVKPCLRQCKSNQSSNWPSM